ncbi:hypothetical protein B0T25DRAFT_130099 [Lasiosphaeria hispida]|uniref:F-box domain-containing protein n=1 Tax=Lasiosphaeria hispida TaxID=260671 RepID=A0AAJ0HSG0_9PEZI|nr:hypothetical protein B0T25DRAFT_130099 [Lasiosphaeria hispida]
MSLLPATYNSGRELREMAKYCCLRQNVSAARVKARISNLSSSPQTQPVPSRHKGSFPSSPKHLLKKMATSSKRLPPELLVQIFDYFTPTGRVTAPKTALVVSDVKISSSHANARSTYASLCRASRLFHALAINHLYNTVHLRDRDELFRFFRTLLECPDRALMVHEFAWVGELAAQEQTSPRLENESRTKRKRLTKFHPSLLQLEDCWTAVASENKANAVVAAAQLIGITGTDMLHQGWRVLGAALAAMVNVQSLLVLHGCLLPGHGDALSALAGQSCYPEESALWEWVSGTERSETVDGAPYRRFLQRLDTLTLEPCYNYQGFSTDESFRALLSSPHSLRRIELNGTMRLPLERERNGDIVSNTVRELAVFRNFYSDFEFSDLVSAFPKLVSLEAEYLDGGPSPLMTPGWNFARPELSLALLRIADTLETLSLTSGLKSSSGVVLSGGIPPLLRLLDQMTALKHLTTESIWLFGRMGENTMAPSFPSSEAVNLPSSLVSFHLIDFWGVSVTLLRMFYPKFPSDWTALEFYRHQLQELLVACTSSLSILNLRDVKFATRLPQLRHGNAWDGPTDPLQSLIQFRDLFGAAGVRFSVVKRPPPRDI